VNAPHHKAQFQLVYGNVVHHRVDARDAAAFGTWLSDERCFTNVSAKSQFPSSWPKPIIDMPLGRSRPR